MKDLLEIISEIKEVCKANPVMEDRLTALKQVGYDNINYHYLKGYDVVINGSSHGLFATRYLPKKNLYRIQIGYTELQKGYPAAWCVSVSSVGVEYEPKLLFKTSRTS